MGRSSELAQRVVRCVSGEIKGERKIKKENKKKRENWMCWQQRERFKGRETQISRKKKGLVLLPGE